MMVVAEYLIIAAMIGLVGEILKIWSVRIGRTWRK